MDQAPAVRDPMDVGVYANPWFAERLGNDEVGGLAPDTLQRQQILNALRDPATEPFDQFVTDLVDHTCLGAIKADRINQALDFGRS